MSETYIGLEPDRSYRGALHRVRRIVRTADVARLNGRWYVVVPGNVIVDRETERALVAAAEGREVAS